MGASSSVEPLGRSKYKQDENSDSFVDGINLSKDNLYQSFACESFYYGRSFLRVNTNFRVNFLKYIKSFTWVDQLSLIASETKESHQIKRNYRLLFLIPCKSFFLARYKYFLSCFPEPSLHSIIIVCIWSIYTYTDEYEKFLESNAIGPRKKTVLKPIESVRVVKKDTNVDIESCFLANLFQEKINNISEDKLNSILLTGKWFDEALLLIDNLDTPVSISRVQFNNGSPLIFVNKSFEKLTLYKRGEILGLDCKFLQNEKTEIEEINKLSLAVKEFEPITACLTNVRKNGRDFLNFLYLYPVSNKNNRCRYMIGLQNEVLNSSQTIKNLEYYEDLLTIIRCFL